MTTESTRAASDPLQATLPGAAEVDQTFVFAEWFSWSMAMTLPSANQAPNFANGYSSTARTWLHPMAAGDFNNDGLSDFIVGPVDSKSTPHILLSDGRGGFERVSNFVGDASRHFIRNGSAADLNGDGWLDFVGFESTHLMSGQRDLILINQQGTGFKVVESPVSETQGHHGGAVGDLDADGRLDIFGIREFGQPNYQGIDPRAPLLQQPDGSFRLGKSVLPASLEAYASGAAAIADLDGDGVDDLVLALTRMAKDGGGEALTYGLLERTPIMAVAFGRKDTPIAQWEFNLIGRHWADKATYDAFMAKFGPPDSSATAGANSIGLLDVNADGRKDIVIGSYLSSGFLQRTGGFQVFVNQGRAFVDRTAELFPNQSANRDFEIGLNLLYHLVDLNADGRKDFLITSNSMINWPENSTHGSYPSVFINHGGGFLPAALSNMRVFDDSVVGAYGIRDMLPGDVNGDGVPDLVSLRNESDFFWNVVGGPPRLGYTVALHLNRAIDNDPRTPMTALGTPGDDQLAASAIKPLVRGLAGNDRLIGRTDFIDTAVYYGAKEDFAVRRDSYGWVVEDRVGNEGTDTLQDIDRISFSGCALALDLGGHAGSAARLLAAVFGKSAAYNPQYAGIALSFFDRGLSRDEVSQVALDVAFGANPESTEVIQRLWTNVFGSKIDPQTLSDLSGLLDSDLLTAAQLTTLAAELDATAEMVGLVALQEAGWVYIPYDG